MVLIPFIEQPTLNPIHQLTSQPHLSIHIHSMHRTMMTLNLNEGSPISHNYCICLHSGQHNHHQESLPHAPQHTHYLKGYLGGQNRSSHPPLSCPFSTHIVHAIRLFILHINSICFNSVLITPIIQHDETPIPRYPSRSLNYLFPLNPSQPHPNPPPLHPTHSPPPPLRPYSAVLHTLSFHKTLR